MIEVDCRPVKEVYYKEEAGYRIVACLPDKFYPELELTPYGNFTIKGNNLQNIKIGTPCSLQIQKLEDETRPGSYALVGLAGVQYQDNRIVVNPDYEYKILCGFMTKSQAKNVNKAYPHFIQQVLNGETDDIDYKNIKNVAEIRLADYQDKIRKGCRHILISCEAMKYGITRAPDINALANKFSSAGEFVHAFTEHPYQTLIRDVDWRFERADKYILKAFPKFVNSDERCLYACLEVLESNREFGNTRMNDTQLAIEVMQLAPDCIRKVADIVKSADEIHYDANLRKVSLAVDYLNETKIAKDLICRIRDSYRTPLNQSVIKSLDGIPLTDEQKKILELAENSSVSILTGMAGSGKSFSTKALVLALEAAFQNYVLLAPTGIASKRLSEATGRQASTIHKFLIQYREFGYAPFDYFIIDEVSMVGVGLFASLLSTMAPDAKIVFIGDNAQLVSISNGNLLQDMIDSQVIPVSNLTKVFRYGIGGIATTSTDVRYGKQIDYSVKYPDRKFVEIGPDYLSLVMQEYQAMLDMGYEQDDIRVLCPFNKDPIGSYAINDAIQAKYNPEDYLPIEHETNGRSIRYKIGDIVLNTHNEYRMPCVSKYGDDKDETIPVMNGDIGRIVKFEPEDEGTREGWRLYVEFDTGVAIYDPSTLKNLLLGYSMSIHKSQGSESKCVIVVIDSCHRQMLSRNIEYVAVSRAKEHLTIIGDSAIMNQALDIQENLSRDTWLKEKLMEGNETICDTL